MCRLSFHIRFLTNFQHDYNCHYDYDHVFAPLLLQPLLLLLLVIDVYFYFCFFVISIVHVWKWRRASACEDVEREARTRGVLERRARFFFDSCKNVEKRRGDGEFPRLSWMEKLTSWVGLASDQILEGGFKPLLKPPLRSSPFSSP